MEIRSVRARWIVSVMLMAIGVVAVARIDFWRALQPDVGLRKEMPVAARTLTELLANKAPEILEGTDIGLLNLVCAQGLRGAENLDVKECMKRLDGIAARVRSETERHRYRFREHPEQFEHSEGYFCMLMMAVVLQEDLQIRYNPDRITPVGMFESNQAFFADARDVFIHGFIGEDRRMGTCASLPVLYVAIGRRLGYPLKLVPAKNHLFVRWEGSRERFNVDATGRGMNFRDDDHYRRWPLPITREEEQEFGYLKSMSTTDELTAFLSLRAECLFAMGKPDEGLDVHREALSFSPQSRLQQLIVAQAEARVESQKVVASLPPEFDPTWNHPGRNGTALNPRLQIRTQR